MSTSYYWEIKSALTSGQSRQRKHSFSFYDTQYKQIKQQEGWYILYICMNDTKQIRHTRKADHGNQFCTYYVFLTLLSNGARNSQIQNNLIKSSICCHGRKLKPLVHWWEEILQTLLHCTGRLHQSLKQVNGGKNKNQTTQVSALTTVAGFRTNHPDTGDEDAFIKVQSAFFDSDQSRDSLASTVAESLLGRSLMDWDDLHWSLQQKHT